MTAAREVHQRRWENKHGEAKPDAAGYLPGDGLTLWVSQQDPDSEVGVPGLEQPEGDGGDGHNQERLPQEAQS